MSKAKLSIHQAAAALLKDLHAPRGSITTMVDIDERRGEVIRVLLAPGSRQAVALHGIPATFMGYPVLVERQPSVYAFGGRRR
jgi:hypothetical protein